MGNNAKPAEKIEQVQLRIRGVDGEWFQPASHPRAVLAALKAIAGDIKDCPGTYQDGDLRKFREALRELDGVITARIGQPGTASPVAS